MAQRLRKASDSDGRNADVGSAGIVEIEVVRDATD
jgi:hypothetical protein